MRTSDSIAKIAPAIVKAQAQCEAVTKDKVGKVESQRTGKSYEYNYADFASVVEHIKPALRENGLAMLQWGESTEGGIVVITRVQHESGEWQESDTFIPVAITTAQAVGSALTYGKRYGAQAFMFLPSADDDGKGATDNPPPAKRPNTATQVAVDALHDMSAEEQDFLRTHAHEIIKLHTLRSGTIYDYIVEQKFDTEEKLALWALLPSDVRSTIKKQQTAYDLAHRKGSN